MRAAVGGRIEGNEATWELGVELQSAHLGRQGGDTVEAPGGVHGDRYDERFAADGFDGGDVGQVAVDGTLLVVVLADAGEEVCVAARAIAAFAAMGVDLRAVGVGAAWQEGAERQGFKEGDDVGEAALALVEDAVRSGPGKGSCGTVSLCCEGGNSEHTVPPWKAVNWELGVSSRSMFGHNLRRQAPSLTAHDD